MKIAIVQIAEGRPLAHPVDGASRAPFAWWDCDQFTCALLRDGAIRRATDEEIDAAARSAEPAPSDPNPENHESSIDDEAKEPAQ